MAEERRVPFGRARWIAEPVQHHVGVGELDAFGVEAEMTAQRGFVDAPLAAADDHDFRRHIRLSRPAVQHKELLALCLWVGNRTSSAGWRRRCKTASVFGGGRRDGGRLGQAGRLAHPILKKRVEFGQLQRGDGRTPIVGRHEAPPVCL